MERLKRYTAEQKKKIIIFVLLDIVTVNFSLLAAICLWYGGNIPGLPGGMGNGVEIGENVWQWFGFATLFLSPLCVAVYGIFRFYSNLWKYATIDDMYKIVVADTIIYGLLFVAHITVISSAVSYDLPKRLLMVAWFIDVVLFVFSRSGYRIVKRFFVAVEHILTRKAGSKRVLVVGAGYSGYEVVRRISNNEPGYENRTPVIIVDDDEAKNNTNIMGIRVTYDCANIERLAKEYEIEEIIVAIPAANNVQMKRIMDFCTRTDCELKMIPPMSNVSDGSYRKLRDVNITDLLFREEIKLDVKSISGYLENKTVLVTGGGGSIGSELCRQIIQFKPKRLIIFDVYENNAYELMNDLKNRYGRDIGVEVYIGSVRDKRCMERLFELKKPEVVFHAAAHKHVPLMEEVPQEAVKNNVFGTLNVANCADKYGVERFVLLSTDKAVNPANVMGATKRVTELIIQSMASRSETKFMAVRFGNVLGSNGSVIPLFQKQISEGGPVTVTDKNMIRFFMTIPEASRLVLQAAGLGKSGSIFVLDMGEPVKIDDLARNLIRLSGFVPDKDIEIAYTGLRPGEKLYEELIMDEEKDSLKMVYKNKIFVTKPVDMDYELFDKQLERLRSVLDDEPERVVGILKEIVPNNKLGEA
jgi:FlaA1/EpsC-like NDP-sugar epimerase